ncbi:MAG: type II toxin-antitoxin system VapC family toxin [Candidatus Geothermarchaeales archaeon]
MRYVDVNVFVYWLGDDPVFGGRATAIIRRIENGERALTSTLTLWLTHIVLSDLSESYSEEGFIKKIRELGFLRIEPLLFQDYAHALELMKAYELDLEDALHLATAMRKNIREIYTNDTDFDRTPIRKVGF